MLLVEDDAIIALTLEDQLQANGYRVTTFGSCATAWKWLEYRTPEIAVLDIKLSDGPCNDLAAELSQRDVPFIVYSGFAQHRNTHPEFAEAVWVEKPASFALLLKALEALRAPQRQHG